MERPCKVLIGAGAQQTLVDKVLHGRQYPMTRTFSLTVEAEPLAAPGDEDVDELVDGGEIPRHVAFHHVRLPAVVRLDLLEFQLAGERNGPVTERHLDANAGLYFVLEKKHVVRLVGGVGVRGVAVGADVHREAHPVQELKVKRQLAPVVDYFGGWKLGKRQLVVYFILMFDRKGAGDRYLRGVSCGS
jgi:hypothetical protein